MDTENLLVIGIDFGTTNSGVAFATAKQFAKQEIHSILSWPDKRGAPGKEPSEICYDGDEVVWGFSVPRDADSLQWFKLLLLRREDIGAELYSSEALVNGREFLAEIGKTPIEVIADYLRALWQHAIRIITKKLGEITMMTKVIKVAITIPAIWRGYARQAMEKAAAMAGILEDRLAGPTTLTLALEPEAAALATMTEPGHEFQVGGTLVICDAGGGTVDLITYKVQTAEPLAIAEAVEGQGDLCRGFLVDQAFEGMCKNKIGKAWDEASTDVRSKILQEEWEFAIKPQFELQGRPEYPVWIPHEMIRRLRRRKDDLKTEPKDLIKRTFEQSFASIDWLIKGQIQRAARQGNRVTGIILVGGMGSSPYLYEHVSAAPYSDRITIFQSDGEAPRTAIARGAVFKGFVGHSGLANHVTSTIARASLGIAVAHPFKEGLHLEEDKFWRTQELCHFSRSQMRWFLKRGDDIAHKQPVKESIYQRYTRSEFDGTFSIDILACEDTTAPSRKIASVKKLCNIEVKLDMSFYELETFVNRRGKKFGSLTVEIEMVPTGASVEFALYVDGRKQGGQNVEVSYH